MKESVCRHQETMFDVNSKTWVSRCINLDCDYFAQPLIFIMCQNCLHCKKLTKEELEERENHLADITKALS